MIHVGEAAPDFEAKATDGRSVRLSALRGRPVILYFFPKAFTPGCTREAAMFRDAYPEVQAFGAEVIGISSDDDGTQCEFAGEMGIPHPMIGDGDAAISQAYGVLWPLIGRDRRVTFVIDERGTVRAVLRHELRIGRHVRDSLHMLERLRSGKR